MKNICIVDMRLGTPTLDRQKEFKRVIQEKSRIE